MPQWVNEGFYQYQKRIRGRIRLDLIEITPEKRTRNPDLTRIMQSEESKIIQALPNNSRVISLDRQGKSCSTYDLSNKIEGWMEEGQSIAFIVGGPEGLSDGFLKKSNETWSLSQLTYAHTLVRVIVAEQIYRCFSILEGSPYHR